MRAIMTRVFGIPKKLRVCRQPSTVSVYNPGRRRPRMRSEAGKVIHRAECPIPSHSHGIFWLLLAYPQCGGSVERGMEFVGENPASAWLPDCLFRPLFRYINP